MIRQSNQQIKAYERKIVELRKEFEEILGKVSEVYSNRDKAKDENESLRMLNNNLRSVNDELKKDNTRLEELIEKAKDIKIKEITDLQNLIYGFEKSKNSLANDINNLVADKERSIKELQRYKDEEKDYSVFIKQTEIDKKKLEKLKNSAEAEQAKVLASKESLKLEIKEFEVSKKANDKKFRDWVHLENKVKHYAKILQYYYDEHNIKLNIRKEFEI